MSDSADSSKNSSLPGRGLRFLGTGLLIAGSAFFGGLAVALWDRKSLAKLREPDPRRTQRQMPPEDDNAG